MTSGYGDQAFGLMVLESMSRAKHESKGESTIEYPISNAELGYMQRVDFGAVMGSLPSRSGRLHWLDTSI